MQNVIFSSSLSKHLLYTFTVPILKEAPFLLSCLEFTDSKKTYKSSFTHKLDIVKLSTGVSAGRSVSAVQLFSVTANMLKRMEETLSEAAH